LSSAAGKCYGIAKLTVPLMIPKPSAHMGGVGILAGEMAHHKDSTSSLIDTWIPNTSEAAPVTASVGVPDTLMYAIPKNAIICDLHSVGDVTSEEQVSVPFILWGALSGP